MATGKEARWGAHLNLPLSPANLRDAAVEAASDEFVWGSLAAALLVQFGDADERISNWAVDNRPLTGSIRRADRLSYDLVYAGQATYWITALLAVSGKDKETWLADKARGSGVGVVALGVPSLVTVSLKEVTGRTRPDGTDDVSLPSGHATMVSAHAALTRTNMEFVRLDPRLRDGCGVLLTGATLACGWARVESANHFPSDVFVGYAVGTFFSRFLEVALTSHGSRVRVESRAGPGMWRFGVRVGGPP